MRAFASIVLIVAAGASVIIASRAASSGTPLESREQRQVVVPTSTDAGPALALASFGVAELTMDDGARMPALHVRATIANTATHDRPWAVDASQARLDLASGTAAVAVAVNSDLTTLPIAIIDPGERRVIDLYFPLPPDLVRRDPASFALTWSVNTPTRVVRHAWFARDHAVVLPDGERVAAAGWGSHWWFDPAYSWSTYFHRPGFAVPRPPNHAIVSRAPRWHESPPAGALDQAPSKTECEAW